MYNRAVIASPTTVGQYPAVRSSHASPEKIVTGGSGNPRIA